MSVERLVAAISALGFNLSGREISEAIWLASRLTELRAGAYQGNDATTQSAGSEKVEGLKAHRGRRSDLSDSVGLRKRKVNALSNPRNDEYGTKGHVDPARFGPDRELFPLNLVGSGIQSNRRANVMRIPGAAALPGALGFGRALRPFLKKLPSLTQCDFDEERSAHISAEMRAAVPVFRPTAEKIFDIALVVEGTRGMAVWGRAVYEFHQLLLRHGAFKDVRRWKLKWIGDATAAIYDATGEMRPLEAVACATAKTLVLVVTDGVAPQWENGAWQRILALWSSTASVTVVHMLGKRLAERTAIGYPSADLRPKVPGVPGSGFVASFPVWQPLNEPGDTIVPLAFLEESSLRNWARVMLGANSRAQGILLRAKPDEPAAARLQRMRTEVEPQQLLNRFLRLASSDARKLAIFFSAVPLTLPVMRLVQRAMMTTVRHEHLAEVMLGGIVERVSEEDSGLPEEEVIYDFKNGVRDLLQNSITHAERARVLTCVSEFVSERFGSPLDFTALVSSASGDIPLSLGAQPFAQLAETPLRAFEDLAAVNNDVRVTKFAAASTSSRVGRLSRDIKGISAHYEVVVIGSGYGGSIAANRMARASRKVCLLERGREFMVGEYPATATEGTTQTQFNTGVGRVGTPLGLVELHTNPDVNVIVGCGLGGTSLINANVAMRPDPRVWDDSRWPSAIRSDQLSINGCYERVKAMLGAQSVPDDGPTLSKLDALRKSAIALDMGDRFYRPPVAVTFRYGRNSIGVEQDACVNCGDCISGCNHNAKNTTYMNYLPDAVAHGAEIYTGIGVDYIKRDETDKKWQIFCQPTEQDYASNEGASLCISADIVVLASGSLGSTSILLRSRQMGLDLSDILGERFSTNGDQVGMAFNTEQEVNSVGWGANSPEQVRAVGPTIAGVIDHRDVPVLSDGYVIHEASIPGPLGQSVLEMLGVSSTTGAETATARAVRIAESAFHGPYRGAMRNTQVYFVTGHDEADGRITIRDDLPQVDWPGAGRAISAEVENTLSRAATALGGSFVQDPSSAGSLQVRRIVIDPLGGCAMADDAQRGVVDEAGRVFSGSHGTEVHPGLFVMDGSVIPVSLGVAPLLTIAALAERNCARLAFSHGWHINYEGGADVETTALATIGIRFTDWATGNYRSEDWGGHNPVGPTPIQFSLRVVADDVEQLLENPRWPGRVSGSLVCGALSPEPMVVAGGQVMFGAIGNAECSHHSIRYRLILHVADGRRLFVHGDKVGAGSSLLSLSDDVCTTYLRFLNGPDDGATVIGTATLVTPPENFQRQLRSLVVLNAPDAESRTRWNFRFGRHIAGMLYSDYGAVASPVQSTEPDMSLRVRRELRAPAPQVNYCETQDAKILRLVRFKGGGNGPVVLFHGSGVSSRIFSTDLVDTNLVEYLCAAGYDVWLADMRVSVELPSALDSATVDDIARFDVPTCIAKVMELSKSSSVQVVGHCLGAIAVTMALMSGQRGVRAAVFSQVSAHPIPVLMQRLRSGLHSPETLMQLGVKNLSEYKEHGSWPHNILDEALRSNPVTGDDTCGSAACHRATFLYGTLYEHDQVNETFHENLNEIFGILDVGIFDQLAVMARAGHVVAAKGDDVYMPNFDRLNLPIALIHGSENLTYSPSGTEMTFDLVRKYFGDTHFERHLIEGYGHHDCIVGKRADEDVYPIILRFLASYD